MKWPNIKGWNRKLDVPAMQASQASEPSQTPQDLATTVDKLVNESLARAFMAGVSPVNQMVDSAIADAVSHDTSDYQNDPDFTLRSTDISNSDLFNPLIAQTLGQPAIDQLMVERGLTNPNPMSAMPAVSNPMVPPNIDESRGVYKWNWPWRYTIPQAPYKKPESMVDTRTLRQFADNYDVLRSCIQHIKREVLAVPIKIVPRDPAHKSDPKVQERVRKAEQFFQRRGGLGGPGKRRKVFESEIIEDICVIGSAAIHLRRNKGGRLYEVTAIDAETVRPRVNAWGWPGPGDEVFEQWVQGVKVAGFTREELWYEGLATNARSWSPFFASPVEWLLATIMSALKADEWNRTWLTDGNVPDLLLGAPQDWTPDQILQYAAYMDAMLSGDSAERHRAKIVPGGLTAPYNFSRKDQDFEEFQLWLLRRTCALLGVQPASIGFAGEQFKTSQADSMASTTKFGIGTILEYRKDIYDDILEENGFDDLECENIEQLNEDPKTRAERHQLELQSGEMTINEAREENGRDPVEWGDIPLVQSFLVPLEHAANPPDPSGEADGSAPLQPDPNQPGVYDAPDASTPDASGTSKTDASVYPGGSAQPLTQSAPSGLVPPGYGGK